MVYAMMAPLVMLGRDQLMKIDVELVAITSMMTGGPGAGGERERREREREREREDIISELMLCFLRVLMNICDQFLFRMKTLFLNTSHHLLSQLLGISFSVGITPETYKITCNITNVVESMYT